MAQDGGSLANAVAQIGPIPETVLANMTFQILWALAYLKCEKRVHRDIKPSNMLVNSRGEVAWTLLVDSSGTLIYCIRRSQVKVSDFGVSAVLNNSIAMCGTFVGTFKVRVTGTSIT